MATGIKAVAPQAQAGWVQPMARAGLISKGIVYCILGLLAFMAAFEIGNSAGNRADKQGVFRFILDHPGGQLLLSLTALGLLCYSAWRLLQAFTGPQSARREKAGTAERIRYAASGLVYLSLAVYAIRMLLHQAGDSSGNANQEWVGALLQKPFGQWLVGLLALAIAGIGCYQAWYGLSEKYRKHVGKMNLRSSGAAWMLRAGKAGYLARGIVWVLIAWLLLKAALHANSSEAGDTGRAFQFIETWSFGSLLLGLIGLGLVCYGLFNFIRARFETFH